MPEIPTVCIITRTLNRPDLLRRAIQSVLNQKFENWQHVIINDGGDPETLKTLTGEFSESYKGRLKLLHTPNQGMQKAANQAIRESDSPFLVIHDDDDSWDPDYLAQTTAFLEKEGPESPYQGVITKTLRILEKETKKGFKELERSPYVPLREISLFRTGYDNPFPPIAFLFRRTALESIGYFDPRWDMVADLDFNFRFLQQFEIGVLNKSLAFYHWRDEKASPDNANTVTLKQDRHARFLNELKNHYMRQASNAREAASALGFQLSAYAVENQWMTTEIRERVMENRLFLENLVAKIQSLQEFNNDGLWPKLNEGIVPRLNDIQKTLQELDKIKSELSDIQVFNHQALWQKLEVDILPKLESLSKALAEVEKQKSFLVDIEQFNHTALWPKLEELHSIPEGIQAVHHFNHSALWPKMVSLETGMAHLHKTLLDVSEKQATGDGKMEDLRKEVELLHKSTQGLWQFGRLRIQWLPKNRGN